MSSILTGRLRSNNMRIRQNACPKEIAFANSMQEIAKLVAQQEEQWDWIRDTLSHFAWRVGSTRAIGTIQKTRQEAFQWAKLAGALSSELERLLDSAQAYGYLHDDGNVIDPDLLTEGRRFLNQVFKASHEQQLFVAPEGNPKLGAGKAVPRGWMSPQQECAIVVAEVWAVAHGKYPSPHMKQPARVAEAYYWASTWKESHRVDDPYSKWRGYFSKLDTPESQPLRKEVKRIAQSLAMHEANMNRETDGIKDDQPS